MENRNDLPIQEAMRLAATPAGQQLIAMLRAQNGDALQSAMSGAAAGDYTQAKRIIESMMSNPQAQQLLKELGR